MRVAIFLVASVTASALAACGGGGGTETTIRTPGGGDVETVSTGIGELDHAINSALAANFIELAGLTGYQMIDCVEAAESLSSPPVCREDESPGNLVEAYPIVRCELVWLRPEVMTDTYAEALGESPDLFAAYRPTEQPLGMPADYVAVFRSGGDDEEPAGVAMKMLGGRIVSLEYSCGDFATLYAPDRVSEFIIAPATAEPTPAPSPPPP